MAGMVKTQLQLAKERIKFFRPLRAAIAPVMNHRMTRIDDEFEASESARYLRSLANSHSGERCFVIGNGPSITAADLELLRNEVSFAANGIYNIFESTSWRPTYYVCVDRNALALHSEEVRNVEAGHVFADIIARPSLGAETERLTYINQHLTRFESRKFSTTNIGFSDRCDRVVYSGYTVTYAALQLALYFGFSEVYLLGVDHSYPKEIDSNNRITDRSTGATHFFGSGGPEGYFYYEGVEKAYQLANDWAATHGRLIANAGRCSNLTIFEKVVLEDLF